MLVPSLSWQNDADFKCKMHRSKQKDAFSSDLYAGSLLISDLWADVAEVEGVVDGLLMIASENISRN